MLGKKTLFKIIYQSIALEKMLNVYYVKIERVKFFFVEGNTKLDL